MSHVINLAATTGSTCANANIAYSLNADIIVSRIQYNYIYSTLPYLPVGSIYRQTDNAPEHLTKD